MKKQVLISINIFPKLVGHVKRLKERVEVAGGSLVY